MALRESIRAAGTALRARPELFALGGAIALLQAGLYALLRFGLSTMAPDATTLVETVAALLSLFVVLPLFVGLYEPTLRPVPSESRAAALRRAVATALRRYPDVLRTDALVALASGLLGLLAAIAWYVAATAGRYVRYALTDPGAPHAMESVYLLAGAALVGAFLGSTLLRFADAVTAFDDRRATAAVAASAIADRRHLLAVAGFAVAVVVVHLASLGALVGVAAAVPAAESALRPALVAVAVALYGVAVTVVGVLHAAFYRDHVAPVPGSAVPADGSSIRRRLGVRSAARPALAVVLVVGLVAGAAAVRTLDPAVHSPPDAGPIATDDPDEAVRAAATVTAASNHRQVLYVRNASDPGRDYRVLGRSGVDHDDRRQYVYFTREDGEAFGGFFGEGTLAMLRPGGRLDGLTAYERESWSVLAAPAWGITDGAAAVENTVVPRGPDEGWRTVSANESALVVRLSAPESIEDAFGARTFGGSTPPLADESHVTVVVDREAGVLDEVRFHLHSLETGRNRQYRLEYRDVGAADLQRPEPIREPRLAERAWDAIYY